MGVAVYCFPVAIGDTVYTEYAGQMETCIVTGFQVLEQGIYVYAQYPGTGLEHPVLLSNICLTPEEAESRIMRKKEEQAYEAGTDGRTGTEELGRCE